MTAQLSVDVDEDDPFLRFVPFFYRCVYLFTASYGVSYGPIGWVLPSEVFPQSVRSKGVALSTASNWYVASVHSRACILKRHSLHYNVLDAPDIVNMSGLIIVSMQRSLL